MPLTMYEPKKQAVIAVAAGKGGVGKSTVTVNLGLALKQLNFRVGILDSDIYGPSIRTMLPEEKLPSQKGDRIQPAICFGMKMISMAYFRKENEAAAIRAPIANGLITQFLRNVDWGELDYLLIDFPPGTGDIQLTLGQQANLAGAVMVTTPQEVALQDVRKAIHLFEQLQVPILGIVENMSYFQVANSLTYPFGKGGGERLAAEVGAPLLGAIPVDPAISQSGDEGSPLTGPSAKIFLQIAERLISEKGKTRLAIQKLWQKAPEQFTIEWSDGKMTEYSLKELQRQCPCAGCVERKTAIDENVEANRIFQVGRYALRIEFSSGCSSGIYSYEMLRK